MTNRLSKEKAYADKMKSRFLENIKRAGCDPQSITLNKIIKGLERPLTCQQ